MLDIKLLRTEMMKVTHALKKRGHHFDWDVFHQLDEERKQLHVQTQELQAQRNASAKQIGQAKSRGEDAAPLLKKVAGLGQELQEKQQRLDVLMADLQNLCLQIPNLPLDSVPEGASEEDNVQLRTWGSLPEFSFTPKNHMELGEGLGEGIDPAAGVRLAGARFTVLRGSIARLGRALTQMMLDWHTKHHGYTEYYVPYLVNQDCLYGTGQLPKFSEDLFHLTGDKALSLIPTSEVPLTNLVRDTILQQKDLPLKMTAHTPCFRSEAGSYGRDMHGLIRQHQFEKVEMVQVVHPQEGEQALEELLSSAEAILQALDLPYRVVELCGGDLGFSAQKTYDLEVWVPSQKTYREISSCSLCGDFQARRMQARYYEADAKTAYVHTLNGSGLAVGRTLLAVLENHQTIEGHIKIPAALQPYLGGLSVIES